MPSVLFELPVPATSLLDSPTFSKRLGRTVALEYTFEDPETGESRAEALVFHGTEAFRCTYLSGLDGSMRAAYAQLIDVGESTWLQDVFSRIHERKPETTRPKHLMILFDDGPCYEFLCQGFTIERVTPASA